MGLYDLTPKQIEELLRGRNTLSEKLIILSWEDAETFELFQQLAQEAIQLETTVKELE